MVFCLNNLFVYFCCKWVFWQLSIGRNAGPQRPVSPPLMICTQSTGWLQKDPFPPPNISQIPHLYNWQDQQTVKRHQRPNCRKLKRDNEQFPSSLVRKDQHLNDLERAGTTVIHYDVMVWNHAWQETFPCLSQHMCRHVQSLSVTIRNI